MDFVKVDHQLLVNDLLECRLKGTNVQIYMLYITHEINREIKCGPVSPHKIIVPAVCLLFIRCSKIVYGSMKMFH